MSRDNTFFDFMEDLFEMTRYIFVFQNTLYNYSRNKKLFITEVHALGKIGSCSGINMTRLARLVHRTKGAISQMISKLEMMGLVEKQVSPQNKSEILLSLTDEGRAVCECHHRAEERIYKIYLDSMDDFSREDFLAASRVLKRILKITAERTP